MTFVIIAIDIAEASVLLLEERAWGGGRDSRVVTAEGKRKGRSRNASLAPTGEKTSSANRISRQKIATRARNLRSSAVRVSCFKALLYLYSPPVFRADR